MSDERLEPMNESETKPDKKAKKDKDKKQKRKNRFVKWFREMKSELKKVVWPTPKQILNSSILVLVLVFISSIVIFCVDQAGSYIVNALIMLGGK